ncbi:hypothetical protein CKO42_16430 [Lamprobacter modestohalophilus]|uniref:Uncharacterized protein n=1 Tax=Lamprobacter modestohalophilus TaxID=1064514 RepID=A0A9X0WBQ5_9GAMM|nr:hypothetical protein [Lamprobacter modestohalophilus]
MIVSAIKKPKTSRLPSQGDGGRKTNRGASGGGLRNSAPSSSAVAAAGRAPTAPLAAFAQAATNPGTIKAADCAD